ncbi:MAG: undecaprenyl-diphosphate phosphatase [Patescibacteria group bacterium]
MTILHAIILGIVEGITEYLPISSTAHLVLASDVLKLTQTEFLKSFEVIIQSGAILAVLVLYWRKFFDVELLKRLVVAFIPAGIIGYGLYSLIKSTLIGNTSLTLWVLGVGGLALILFEKYYFKNRAFQITELSQMSYSTCFKIGICQALSVVPGVSRAAATIVGGMTLGVSRSVIVEFSFLLAVPTLVAATALDIFKNPSVFESGNFGLLAVGFVISFITAIIAITWLLRYIKGHTFTAFGWYRIIIAMLGAILL